MWLKTEPFANDTTQPILPGRLARLEAEAVPDDLWGSPGLSPLPLDIRS
jgi:hypothetical protein